MPSDKHNLIMAIVTGLISSLFNVASSRDFVLLKLTFVFLWTSFFSPLQRSWWFVVHALWLWCKTRVRTELAGALLTLFVAPYMLEELEANETKHSDTPWSSGTLTFKSINEACALTIGHSVFFVMVGFIVEILFLLFCTYNAI